jgi:O-antigen/teichoic acid export membrane protein
LIELEKIKERIISELASLRANKKVAYHTGMLFAAQVVVIVMGFVTKGIQTRALTPEGYGLYAFFTSLTGFSVLFFNFGLFPTLEVMLASNSDKKREKELFGIGFLLTLAAGILFSLFLLAISFFIDQLFHIRFENTLRLVIPLCFTFPFRLLIPSLAIGSNKISFAALFDVLFQVLFAGSLAFLFFFSSLTLTEIIVLNLGICLLVLLIMLFLFKPSAHNFSMRFREVAARNREFGIHYYVGSIFSETTYKLDEICITYFINTTQLGFYSLANIICTPMVMLSNAVSSALFKRFSSEERIHPKIFYFNISWIILSLVVLYFLAGWVIELLFGSGFSDINLYVMPLAISYVFKTLCQPFAFLIAKGKGKEIRNVSIAEGIVSVVTNLTFIPVWGVMGAVYSSILARLVDFVGLYYYYRKHVQAVNNK